MLLQARDRTELLEVSVAEAQESEGHIIEFQEWLNDVDALLTARIENDFTADDLPDDVQVCFIFYLRILKPFIVCHYALH